MSAPPTPTPPPPAPLPDDVRGALAGLLAPADAFGERVRRRVDELEREEAERGARLARAPERLRIAAGLFPPGLLPAGLALGTGKSVGAKGFATFLAAPAVSFVMVLLTLAAGMRTLWRLRSPDAARAAGSADADSPEDARALIVAWWRRNRGAAGLSLLVVGVLALLGHPETVLLIVLLSTCAAVLQLGEIARAGLAAPAQVGRWTAGLLWNLAFYGFMSRDLLPLGAGGESPTSLVAILFLGAPLCLVASGQLTWRRLLDAFDAPVQRMRHRDLPSVICLRGLMGLLALALLAGLVLALGAIAMIFVSPRPARAPLVESARTFDARPEELARWEEFEHLLSLLATDGGAPPDVTAAARVVRATVERDEPLPYRVARTAARFRLVGEETLERWAHDPVAELLRTNPTAVPFHADVQGATIHALVHTRSLDRAESERLADFIEADWPAPDAPRVLADLRGRVELLEALGQSARVQAHQADIRAAVLLAWPATHHAWWPARAFLWDEKSASSGLIARGRANFRPQLWAPTDDALMLLARSGIPDELDLEPLRDALGRALLRAHVEARLTGPSPTHLGVELVGLRLSRLLPDARPGGWLGALIRSRLLVAVLGLVALCVVASARGARSEEGA